MEFKQRASVAHTDHSSHPSEPVIDQSRLPDTSPRNDGHDVYVLVCPSFRSRNRRASTIEDRKSTRLNSSHTVISYAVFCLKKKKIIYITTDVNCENESVSC